jgi:CBS domain containing-hemolysin-like protein
VSLAAAVFALAAALVAALCAFADGALLGLEDDEPPSDARVVALVKRRERAHRALAFGRIVAQLLAGAATSLTLLVSGWVPARLLAPVVVGAGIALVILSEVASRSAGNAAGLRGITAVMPFVDVVEIVCAPVVAFGSWADRLLHTLLPPPPEDDEDREDAVERFREVVAAEADVEGTGEVLLHGVFSLGDTQVHEIMVPRVDIVGLEQETHWSEVADRVRSARHARLVVFDGTLDEVVGVLYAKDLLTALLADEEPAGGWQALVRPALFIPSSKSVEAQLREFRASRRHLAIVVDEFGGTAGLVTLEDVLELIVGDIQDEGDVERPEVERGEGGRLWVAAGVTLDVLSDLTGHELRRGDVTTVGGLVMELLGRVPRAGEELLVGGHRLVVERVVRRRIERVYLEPLVGVPASGEES